MSFTCKLLIFLFLFIFATVARGQISIHPPAPNQPVCINKKDAYALALADMQGTLAETWSMFVAEGRCCYLAATYLYTIDTYKDSTNIPSRVIELLYFGERVWGIREKLPKKGVWIL